MSDIDLEKAVEFLLEEIYESEFEEIDHWQGAYRGRPEGNFKEWLEGHGLLKDKERGDG